MLQLSVLLYSKVELWLTQKPLFGLICSLSSALLSFIADSTPILQYTGLVIGIMIGAITLIGKLKDIYDKFKK